MKFSLGGKKPLNLIEAIRDWNRSTVLLQRLFCTYSKLPPGFQVEEALAEGGHRDGLTPLVTNLLYHSLPCSVMMCGNSQLLMCFRNKRFLKERSSRLS